MALCLNGEGGFHKDDYGVLGFQTYNICMKFSIYTD